MHIERNTFSRGSRTSLAVTATLAASLIASLIFGTAASAATLDRINETGSIRLGYLVDARPFTYKTEAEAADGYAVGLCARVVDAVKKQLGIAQLKVYWVPVPFEARLRNVKQGTIDLLCAPTSITLSRRQDVSFSIPIFPGGSRAVLRSDAPAALREVFNEKPSSRVVWRGSPAAKVLEKATFAVVSGTTTEKLLARRLATFQVNPTVVSVPNYTTGLSQVIDRDADIFLGDHALILATTNVAKKDLVIIDRQLSHEPFALALARGDEDFRLLVDRALSKLYASDGFRGLYTKWFGEFNEHTSTFFLWNTMEQ